MNFLKKVAAVSAIAISSFSANATVAYVGGITWDTAYVNSVDTLSDFFAVSDYEEMRSNSMISGSGTIGLINGTDSTDFCMVAGCSLSYTFGDFTVNGDGSVSGGSLDFYVDHADNSPSTHWLSLTSKAAFETYNQTLTVDGLVTQTSFSAYFDVNEIVGTAWYNFDTNSEALNTDFALISATNDYDTDTGLTVDGTADFFSNSVPAPTTLAIFGLGLLGLARLRKA